MNDAIENEAFLLADRIRDSGDNGHSILVDLLTKKKVGKWDEPASDAEIVQIMSEDSVVRDVMKLVESYRVRINEAETFETPPTQIEKDKQLHLVASQIIKTLKAEQ